MAAKKQTKIRSALFLNLVNEILGRGVYIPNDDIEKVVELYLRTVLSTNEGGFDNANNFTVEFDPFAIIDFENMDDDTVKSINSLAVEMFHTFNDLHKSDPDHYDMIEESTINCITYERNIIAVFSEVQKMIHYIGAMALDALNKKGTKPGMANYYEFCSCTDKNKFVISAVKLLNNKNVFVVQSDYLCHE